MLPVHDRDSPGTNQVKYLSRTVTITELPRGYPRRADRDPTGSLPVSVAHSGSTYPTTHPVRTDPSIRIESLS